MDARSEQIKYTPKNKNCFPGFGYIFKPIGEYSECHHGRRGSRSDVVGGRGRSAR